ncbi:MAG TPA: glycine oxidase ThiO [Candidatus Angelobacter sp.]|nr:glycine oxidase ThiO [Candidatus Angelobacter sp.]
MNSWDVIISGAGIIGVSLALELRERGATVLVLDKSEPGQEASSAAAGMLAAGGFETPPALCPLALQSARMFPEYIRKLEALSGVKTDFRQHGTIVFQDNGSTAPALYKKLGSDDLRRLEPPLHNPGQEAFFVQEDTVDPRLLMQAALAAAHKSGVDIRGNTKVLEIRSAGSSVEVETAGTTRPICGRAAVNCQGAWAGAPVKPRKGQMLYVCPEKKDLLQHVVHAPEVYIVPRSSGKILIGATVEDVGFDKAVAPSTIQQLLNAAARYLPELESAPIVESWAGLRPGTPDDLPILGPTDMPNVFAATGHFRNGILLAPITAKIMANLIMGQPVQYEISSFSPARFGHEHVLQHSR